jgi:hypothetical protein
MPIFSKKNKRQDFNNEAMSANSFCGKWTYYITWFSLRSSRNHSAAVLELWKISVATRVSIIGSVRVSQGEIQQEQPVLKIHKRSS